VENNVERIKRKRDLLRHKIEIKKHKNKKVRHFKGQEYLIVDFAKHTETGETLVIYRALYGNCKLYARPLNMFASEVDKEKYPEVCQRFRMELI
jgi:hypothetical protein